MRTVIASILIAVLVVLVGGSAFVYSGLYDVAATDPHWPVTLWALETARTRSIRAQASGIEAPPGLDDPTKILIGVEHFAAHCAVCHGAPGVPKGDIAQGLYPAPPDLVTAGKFFSDGELFWIVKHGIKMTGMPSWSDHSDQELWATVAFLKALPGLTEQDYAKLVMASMTHGGHHGSGKNQTEQTSPDEHQHH
jgi:mono/diheme cytochrome c family protein